MRMHCSCLAVLATTFWMARLAMAADAPEPNQPIGKGRGIHPGRVVWVHDPKVLNWDSPADGHWWEPGRTDQARADAMMARAVCDLTHQPTVAKAWDQLFRHLNQSRGKGDVGYKAGEKVAIKPNWVGMIYREGHVNEATYGFKDRHDYMNTSPQLILSLIRQLVKEAGVRPADITVCDTLAFFVNEFHAILTAEFPDLRCEDYGGRSGRIKVATSTTPLYWSCRPTARTDYLPTCFAEAAYIINFANFKAHSGSGVTLTAKNHYGSLVRWPVERGFYDMHPNCFSKATKIYRPQVDLIGHDHLGGKTVLCLIDGLFTGLHPRDPLPSKMKMAPFDGRYPCSLFASQDPVAIDSVAFDFLYAEVTQSPRQPGVDDYLHEAALAENPPSGTFYDPNHATPTKRLPSLGVHEHWNNAQEKKYSRNLGKKEGIELVPISLK